MKNVSMTFLMSKKHGDITELSLINARTSLPEQSSHELQSLYEHFRLKADLSRAHQDLQPASCVRPYCTGLESASGDHEWDGNNVCDLNLPVVSTVFGGEKPSNNNSDHSFDDQEAWEQHRTVARRHTHVPTGAFLAWLAVLKRTFLTQHLYTSAPRFTSCNMCISC